MNTLTFKLMNPKENTWIKFDDVEVKPQKDKGGHNIYSIKTDKQKIDVTLYKYLEVNSPFYIFWQIFFFIISLFGVFNKRLEKNCVVLKYHATINLENDTTVIARINTNYKEQTALSLETTAQVVEHENQRMIDKQAKKRLKILKVIKICLWLALIAFMIIMIVNR